MARFTKPARPVSWPPSERPIVVFDGECAFCRQQAARWRAAAGDRLDFEPAQTAGKRFPEISAADFARAMVLIDTDGRAYSGAAAVLHARSIATQRTWLLAIYDGVPGLAAAAEVVYRIVARHRSLLPGFTCSS